MVQWCNVSLGPLFPSSHLAARLFPGQGSCTTCASHWKVRVGSWCLGTIRAAMLMCQMQMNHSRLLSNPLAGKPWQAHSARAHSLVVQAYVPFASKPVGASVAAQQHMLPRPRGGNRQLHMDACSGRVLADAAGPGSPCSAPCLCMLQAGSAVRQAGPCG